jgi:hypothetical protein
VNGLKTFSPTDSDPRAVLKRTIWLANELDQEAISTEDQVALTAVLSATHIHETKMGVQSDIQHVRDDFLTAQNDLADAQRRISKLEDIVRALTVQKTATATDSPKLAQLMEVTSAHGQTLDLSVPKGKALVSLKSSRTSSPTPSVISTGTRDGERTRTTTEDSIREVADAFARSAEDDKLRLRAVLEATKTSTRLEENVGLADRSRTHVVSDANEHKVKSAVEQDIESSASGPTATDTVQKLPEYAFAGNDKPLPPVPAAQAFPQFEFDRNAGHHKQVPMAVGPDPPTMVKKENIPPATTTFDAATFDFAKPVPAVTQSPQVPSSTRAKGKTTKWKDPPIFQDDEPASAPTPFQFSVSSPAFNASGQSDVSTEHATETQKSAGQFSQQSDLKQTAPKVFTSNENTRQLGSIVKVLQENKKLGEDKPLQKKPEKKPVFASADAMMKMIQSIAPDSVQVVSPKPAVAASSHPALPMAPSAPSTLPTATLPTTAPTAASTAAPTVAPTVASRAASSTPSNDSQTSFLEVPKTPTKKRKSAVKLVKPESELPFLKTASSSITPTTPTTHSSIKQEKPAQGFLLASTPPAQATTSTSVWPSASSGSVWGTSGIGSGVFERRFSPLLMTQQAQQGASLPPPPGKGPGSEPRVSTSPSTVTTSSPLTPAPAAAPAPIIKITQVNKSMNASVPAFAPPSSIRTVSSSSASPSPLKKAKREAKIPEGLKEQMTPEMIEMFSGNLKRI